MNRHSSPIALSRFSDRVELIRSGPFRLFFPLGIAAGLWGVGHWVLWSIGWVERADKLLHMALQVEGFLACFVIGFMLTAIPRFFGAPPASLRDILGALCLELVTLALILGGSIATAQLSFFLCVIWTLVFVWKRMSMRSKSPPASFLLLGFGFLHAAFGAGIFGLGLFYGRYGWIKAGQQMLELGFMLCLVLGIAGYLLPFLTGYASDPSVDPAHAPLRSHQAPAIAFHAVTGAAILISFLLPDSLARSASFLRAMAVTVHFLSFGHLHLPLRKRAAHLLFFWTSCWMITIGLWATALWPEFAVALKHIVFISGFSLLIFSFGAVVVLSHTAHAALLNGKLWMLKLVGGLTLLAAAARVLADFDAWRYKFWIHFAAGSWWLAALLWLVYLLPKLWRAPVGSADHAPSTGRSPVP